MKTEYDVLIIGGGPAGLAAAYTLRQQGVHNIAVVDRESQPGGVPRHCGHPTFGLLVFKRPLQGPRFAEKMLARCDNIPIFTQTTAVALHPGGEVTLSCPQGIHTVRAKRVLLATGARETPRHPRLVSGTRPQGVMTTGALQQWIYLNGRAPCRAPIIVGSELVSFSALWTLRNAGIQAKAMIEAHDRITAYRPCALFATLMKTPIYYQHQLTRIRGIDRVESVELHTPAGNKVELACDAVIFSGRFVGESALSRNSHLVCDSHSGIPVTDQMGRCSDPHYFALGNLIHPADMGDQCYQEGERLARHLAQELHASTPTQRQRLPIVADGQIRVVAPACLDISLPSESACLNIRVSSPVNGDIIVKAGDRILYQSHHRCFPERRILLKRINLSEIPANATEVSVSIV